MYNNKSSLLLLFKVCTTDGTIVAKISQASIDRLKREDMMLHHMIERVLLQASLIELANIDVS